MKKGYLFILPALCLFLASCENLLSSESHSELNPDNFVTSAKEADHLLQGCYSDLGSDPMYSLNLSMIFDLSTDIAMCEGGGTSAFRVVPSNTHNPSTEYVEETWKALYNAIYNANYFIELVTERMGQWSVDDQILANIQIGEAKGLRALYYFELVRLYGNISLILSTDKSLNDPRLSIQASPNDVYTAITQDLIDAAEALPWSIGDPMDVRPNNAYRFSKGAAWGRLAKVYATWAGAPVYNTSKWILAADAAKKVIDGGKHGLLTDYETLWKNTCNNIWDPTESLLEVSFYSISSSSGHSGRIGKWNGVKTTAVDGERTQNAAQVKVIGIFSEEWKTHNDPRYALSIADYKYGYTEKVKDGVDIVHSGKITYEDESRDKDGVVVQKKLDEKISDSFNPAKWDTEKYVDEANELMNANESNVNWYILRYSDVLLLYAEALTELEKDRDIAISVVNQVRERGYKSSIGNIQDQSYDELRKTIRRERNYELCFEGHRRADLVRWDVYYETIEKTFADLKIRFPLDYDRDKENENLYPISRYTVKGQHELLPIPLRELDLMTNYDQNPMW